MLFFRGIAVCVALSLLSACAAGNRYVYDGGSVKLDHRGARVVAVAASEQRPYVRNQNKTPDFVGLQRGRFGNPWDVKTASHRSLEDDMATTLTDSLKTAGYRATFVPIPPGYSFSKAKTKLLESAAPRSLLLRIDEWKSDTMKNSALYYDLTLIVLDAKGLQLTSKRINGEDDLGGSFFMAPATAKKSVPEAYRLKLEALLNAPEIVAAMK